jgi:hypothetical protein
LCSVRGDRRPRSLPGLRVMEEDVRSSIRAPTHQIAGIRLKCHIPPIGGERWSGGMPIRLCPVRRHRHADGDSGCSRCRRSRTCTGGGGQQRAGNCALLLTACSMLSGRGADDEQRGDHHNLQRLQAWHGILRGRAMRTRCEQKHSTPIFHGCVAEFSSLSQRIAGEGPARPVITTSKNGRAAIRSRPFHLQLPSHLTQCHAERSEASCSAN